MTLQIQENAEALFNKKRTPIDWDKILRRIGIVLGVAIVLCLVTPVIYSVAFTPEGCGLWVYPWQKVSQIERGNNVAIDPTYAGFWQYCYRPNAVVKVASESELSKEVYYLGDTSGYTYAELSGNWFMDLWTGTDLPDTVTITTEMGINEILIDGESVHISYWNNSDVPCPGIFSADGEYLSDVLCPATGNKIGFESTIYSFKQLKGGMSVLLCNSEQTLCSNTSSVKLEMNP